MSTTPDGYFQHFVDQDAWTLQPNDRQTIGTLHTLLQPIGQLHRAGSIAKGTAIRGSDLDLCLETRAPITVSERRALRKQIAQALGRTVTIRAHVVRVAAEGSAPRIDIAFTDAAFGGRPLPDRAPFQERQSRCVAVRAFKLWTRGQGSLPSVPGWASEALVIGLDKQSADRGSLGLFLHLMGWLAERADPGNVEAILRPAAHPTWNPQWSRKLPGRMEALKNGARRLLGSARPKPEHWTSSADVGSWLQAR